MKATLDNNRPIFLQIKENIEEDILNGILKPDEQIPSNRQLVSFYNINPVTALKGVGALAEEGVLYKKRGAGMFVSPGAPEVLRRRYREAFKRERLEPLVRMAAPLGIALDELLAMVAGAWEESR